MMAVPARHIMLAPMYEGPIDEIIDVGEGMQRFWTRELRSVDSCWISSSENIFLSSLRFPRPEN